MSKIEIETPVLGIETDHDKNFRHSMAMLATAIQGKCYDAEIPAAVLLSLAEARCRDIRAKYLPIIDLAVMIDDSEAEEFAPLVEAAEKARTSSVAITREDTAP